MSNFSNWYFNYLTSTTSNSFFSGQVVYHGFKIAGAQLVPFRRLPETDKNTYDSIALVSYEINPGTHSSRWALYLSKFKTLKEVLTEQHMNIMDSTCWGLIANSNMKNWYDTKINDFNYGFTRNLIIGILWSTTIYCLTDHENELICVSFAPDRSKFKSFKNIKDFIERSMFEYEVEPGVNVWFINQDLQHNLNYKSKLVYTENHKLESKKVL